MRRLKWQSNSSLGRKAQLSGTRAMRSQSPVTTFFPSTIQQHSPSGASARIREAGGNRPQVAEKINLLKKELHRINKNLKLTIKRIQSGAAESSHPEQQRNSSL